MDRRFFPRQAGSGHWWSEDDWAGGVVMVKRVDFQMVLWWFIMVFCCSFTRLIMFQNKSEGYFKTLLLQSSARVFGVVPCDSSGLGLTG